jgi:hypothetical protein
MHFHAVIWLDHRAAKIIGFDLHGSAENTLVIHSPAPPHLHHKSGVVGSGHAHDDPSYFEAIADAVGGFREILIAGPADAKVHLQGYLKQKHPEVAIHVTGSEAMEQCSDAEIIKAARDFFRRADRMTPQR